MRPLLIALEGIDGSGTTTHAALLAEWIRGLGLRVHRTREPSAGPVGQLLRALLARKLSTPPDTMALLFAADRVDHLVREIEPQIQAGAHVVSDRYLLSSLAYQSVGSPLPWVEALNSRARPPDACFVLAVSAEVAAERRAQRASDELFDELGMQRAIAEAYTRLAPKHGAVVLDGERSIGDVQADLRSHLAKKLGIE